MRDLLVDGPASAPLVLVLAHGAGAGADHPFLEAVARGLAGRGWRVVRFDFPYMARARAEGRRRPPDRPERLRAAFLEAVAAAGAAGRLVVGGKSMGGRVAVGLAGEAGARGAVALGYPFHAPGRPGRVRLDPLRACPVPVLVVQGERDPFGRREEVEGYDLPGSVRVEWAPDGDHSLAPRRASGRTAADNLALAVDAVHAFLAELAP